jgi:hypothetical protein
MNTQKFQRGDLVRIADDLGPMMSHSTSGCDAIVVGSYRDQFGGPDSESYTLFLEDRGESSWYYGDQLTLIEREQHDLLKEWDEIRQAAIKRHSNLDWIFSNGPEVLENCYGSALTALGMYLGIKDMWGGSGEGFVFFDNCQRVLFYAKPFLENNDLDGFINQCHSMRTGE